MNRLRNRWRWTSTTAIAFVLAMILSPQPRTTANSPLRFQDVVERHFGRWAYGNSVLTDVRVRELVLRLDVRGAEAAAIAAIHLYQNKAGHEAQKVTRAFLTSSHKEDVSHRRDQAAVGANFSHNYQSFLKHIQSAPRKVFAVERPKLDGISQGHLGDCYFVAAVGAQTHRNSEPIIKLIHPKDDRSYDVRFPNGKHVNVPGMTDAQLALGSTAGHQGIWLNVLEVAAGIVEVQSRKASDELPLDSLGKGGDSVFSIQLLTGHKAVKHRIRPAVKGLYPAPAENDVPHLAAEYTRLISDALKHRRLVCCGVGRWDVPPGIIKWHQYAIVGMKHDHVEIWNPWGATYHFKPKGEPGLKHGYSTTGGHFSMPVRDFVRVFGAINIETDEHVK